MVNISRVQTKWLSFLGAPGLTTMYALDPVPLLGQLHTFFLALEAYMPTGVETICLGVGDVIDPLSGDLVGDWSSPVAVSTLGSGGVAYAAPVGASVQWRTGTVINGHRLNGRTFLVPLANTAFDGTGTLAPAALAGIQAAATALVTAAAGNLVVWNRPRIAPARAGGFSAVTSAKVPDAAAVLRSRRD